MRAVASGVVIDMIEKLLRIGYTLCTTVLDELLTVIGKIFV